MYLPVDLTKDVAKWIIAGEDASKLLFRSDLAESQSIREEGTCNWIFEQANFKSWYKANKNAVAWYNAPPGSGKTILSAAIAHQIEQAGGQVVYYRFSFDDGTRKTPLAALRSIALQLRTIMGKIPPQLVELYNKELDHHAYQLHDHDIAIQVVQTLILQIPRIHIIVDGLDECNDIGRGLGMFDGLVQSNTYGIAKWFFTSRDDSSIRNVMLNKLQATELTPPRGKIMDDITLFLDAHGSDKLALNDCAECVQYWTAASEENFLYSKLMFDIICGDGVTCSDEIHEELRKFPPGLTGCYMRCLESLTRKKEPERNLARYELPNHHSFFHISNLTPQEDLSLLGVCRKASHCQRAGPCSGNCSRSRIRRPPTRPCANPRNHQVARWSSYSRGRISNGERERPHDQICA